MTAFATSSWWRLLRLVGRHQLASIVTTGVDFATMIAAVQLCGAPAWLGAVLGASSGAMLNFQLGRRWTFGSTDGPVGRQALRYALVSGVSAAINGLGELALNDAAHVSYVPARALVAVVVSLGWNLPMQRRFVFAAPEPRA